MLRTFQQMTFNSKISILGILVSSLGTFMFMPYISIYISSVGYSAIFVGFILLLFSISQQGFTFFGGVFSDIYGLKKISILGLIIRCIGYSVFLFTPNTFTLVLGTILVGFGGAFLTPSLKVAMTIGNNDILSAVYALRNTVINIGAAVGPIIGGLLYFFNVNYIFIFSLIVHILVLVLVGCLLKSNAKIDPVKSIGIKTSIALVLQDKRLVYLTLIMSFFYFLYVQFNITIPLYIKDIIGKPELVGVLFSLNGILVIFLQYPLIVFVQKRMKEVNALKLGIVFTILSYLALTTFNNFYIIIVYVIFLTLAEILIPPSMDNLASKIAPPEQLGSYLGFISYSFMIGGGLGSFFGGVIYNLASNKSNMFIMWSIFLVVGLIAIILLQRLSNLFNVEVQHEKRAIN